MAKIGVFFAEGYEEIEALAVVDLCRRAGIEVLMVATDGVSSVAGSHGIRVSMDIALADVDFDSLDMLVLPGGKLGTERLEGCEALCAQLDRFYEDGKWIAAICAAPSIFGHRMYLKGRRATSYPAFEGHLEGAEVTESPAVCDGNVITGRGMGTAIDFGLLIVEKLVSRQAADELAKSIVYERERNGSA